MIGRAVAVIGGLALAPAARAYTLQVCLEFSTDFAAGSVGAGDDWTVNTTRAARGVRMKALSDAGVLSTAWADWEGPNRGCATFALDPARTYDVFVESQILVNGVTVQSREGPSEATSGLDLTQIVSDFRPASPPPTFVSISQTLATDNTYRWLAVTGWMFSKSDLGLAPTTFFIYPDIPSSGAPLPLDDGDVYGTSNLKFLLAHEFGHAIGNRIEGTDVSRNTSCGTWDMGGQPAENNCRAEIGSGAPKSMFSMEYDAMALREGWADFIAAWAWNEVAESDCVHGRWGTVSDFDLDNDTLESPAVLTDADSDNDLNTGTNVQGWVSCEGIPVTDADCLDWGFDCDGNELATPLASYVTARDWLEDLTVGADAFGCTSATLYNRSTAGDWIRFFWDLRTDEDVGMEALAELWDHLDPSTLDPDDNTLGSCGNAGNVDDLWIRMHAPVTGAKFTTTCGGTLSDCADEVDAQADNGQDHAP